MSINSPLARSSFPEADANHLIRIISAGGIPHGDPRNMDPEDLLILMELDYFLWQQKVPRELDRSSRYDLAAPGVDPLVKLFEFLPTPSQDEANGKDEPWIQLKHDRVFVFALWPFANSSLQEVYQRSADKQAVDIWWVARFAFSLGNQKDYNNIKNYFMQGLAGLYRTTPGAAGNPINDASGTQTSVMKLLWISYCYWISTGRCDDQSPLQHHQDMIPEMYMGTVLGVEACTFCGFRPREYHSRASSLRSDGDGNGNAASTSKEAKPKMYYCGGCAEEIYPHMKRRYCSPECQKRDWKAHRPFCQQQKHFLRAAYLLEMLSIKFEASTFTGWATQIHDLPDKPTAVVEGARKPVEGFVVSPTARAHGPWTGAPVFPDDVQLLALEDSHATDLRAWDAGSYIYIHLRPFIVECLRPYCANLVQLTVYVRNAHGPSVLASDFDRNTKVPLLTKGRNPLFHPHPVLYARLRNSDAEVIIDLHASIFGWSSAVVSYDTFIRNRAVSIVSAMALAGGEAMPHHWCPKQEVPLRHARDFVMREMHAECRLYLAERTKCRSLYQVSRLTEDKWKATRNGLMSAMTRSCIRARRCVNKYMGYRQYLVYEANPYGAEFRLGITPADVNQELFNGVWLSPDVWLRVVAKKVAGKATGDKVEDGKDGGRKSGEDPNGHKDTSTSTSPAPGTQQTARPRPPESRWIIDLWLDRLVKKSQKNPGLLTETNAVEVFGDQMAKLYNVGAVVSPSDCDAVDMVFQYWQHATADDLNLYYTSPGLENQGQGAGASGDADGSGPEPVGAQPKHAPRMVQLRKAMLREDRESAKKESKEKENEDKMDSKGSG